MSNIVATSKLIFLSIFLCLLFILLLIVPKIIHGQYYGCTYHAYKLCVGNSIYWYSGCNQQQDLYLTCYNGQTCQYGQCVNYVAPTQPVQPSYNPYYRTACYNNSIYWYDSLGVISGLYKSCADTNTCTQDTCSTNKCQNTLKCDGSACAVGSADYNVYCQPQQTNPAPTPSTPTPSEPTIVSPEQNQSQPTATAAVFSSSATTNFWGFVRRWFVWILIGLVLIFLFVVVFRRLSSNV